jgi:hypothetical protein
MSKRWNADGYHADFIVEVLTEPAPGDLVFEVSATGTDQPESKASPLDVTWLEPFIPLKVEEFGLQVKVEFEGLI